MQVEIVGADHQNKPDVGSSIARQWIDIDKVDAIVDVPNSAVALAVNEITREKNKVFIGSGAATSDLTGQGLLAEHRALDLRHLGAGQRHRQGGGEDRRRHLVLPHRRLRLRPGPGARHIEAVVRRTAARCSARCAIRWHAPTSPPSCCRRRPQAQIIGLANAGGDTINSIKQAAEFGIVQGGQKLAGLLVFITDVHALGLQAAQGAAAHRSLLLGPERRHPRLVQAVRRAPTAANTRP